MQKNDIKICQNWKYLHFQGMGEDGEGFPVWVAVSKCQQWSDSPSLAGELHFFEIVLDRLEIELQ